ncbi:DNA internalization-related competence protein ComEC/Rec2 [Neisseria leonii]|uniref:DNA internalization-related competence protein ComEC/Rec2 n=1 Tax=Neisseria leonii TaxID=2995413 RepID=A0A9X4IAU1_9NEIS|nr:DNA internalization-related competence protein ComEC/Rec2 [Neisseria sp. 51.81]MDD9327745.1 DNA internalization-related competence protein ComEC/Rec2 [Neisseria sp. 51.81]
MRRYLAAWPTGVLLSFGLADIPPLWLWTAAAVLLLSAALRFRRLRPLPVLLAGAAFAVWQVQTALDGQWPAERQGREVLLVRVADLPQTDGRRTVFAADAWTEDKRYYRLRLSDYEGRDWPAGSYWRVSARLRPPVGEVNLRGFNREAWALANGLAGIGSVGAARTAVDAEKRPFSDGLAAVRTAISLRWQRWYGQGADNGVALMRALSVGEQGALSDEMWQVLRPLGLNHLVSISGLHVSMVALLAAVFGRVLLKYGPHTPKRPRLWLLTVGLAAAWAYAALAGFAVPTVRAAAMLTVVALAWARGGTASAWTAWWAALAGVLTLWPTAVLAAGTWLSFGLVGALLWGGSWRTGEQGGGLWRAQWAAGMMSAVMLGYGFAVLPLWSPAVNLPAIPWFSWVLVPLALAASAIPWPPLQQAAVWLGEYTWRALAWLAEYAPEWSVAAAPWPLAAAAFCAVAVWLVPAGLGLRPWAAAVLLLFVLYRPERPPSGRLNVTVLDSGQGLAVWLQTANRDLLFDTGTAAAAGGQVIPALRAAGVRRLDTLVFSHRDNDHDGGGQMVRQAFAPDRVWAGQPEFYSGARHCSPASWQWDGVHFEWLTPEESADSDNGKSCVLRAVAGGEAVLLTGDLDSRGEQRLIAQYGSALFSQLLILGHHGSNTSSAGRFLNLVSPEYAVASSGYANAYGHPSPAVQNRVRAHGGRLLRTDLSGAWRFELGTGQRLPVQVRPWRPYWQKKPFDWV